MRVGRRPRRITIVVAASGLQQPLESNEGPARNGGTARWQPDHHKVKVRHASSRHGGSTTAAIVTRSRNGPAPLDSKIAVTWLDQDRRKCYTVMHLAGKTA